MLTFFFALFGLLIGSFLNVVVLRFESGMTLGGRSHCPHCRALIHWYDNIPLLSWLVLRGRCRSCHGPIAWQYPAVEAGTAILFGLVAAFLVEPMLTAELMLDWRVAAIAAGYLALMSFLVLIVVADMRTMTIPIVFLGGALAAAGAIVIGHGLWPDLGPMGALTISWWGRLAAGLIAFGLFYTLVYCSRETWMGMGDAWLALTFGLVIGIELLLFALTVSFFIGSIVGGALLLLGQKSGKSQIPFAPFLIIGLIVSLVIAWVSPWWLPFFLLPLGSQGLF